MNSKPPKTSKLTKSITRIQSSPTPSTPSLQHSSSLSSLPCVSSHLAMIELKQRILTSIAKLSDRDTQQIAIEELQTLIKTLQNDSIPMLLNCLFHASSTDPKPFVKKETIRLLGTVSVSHVDCCEPHLGRIIGFLAKALRENDSGVREACKDVIGELSRVYLKSGEGALVSLFVKPVFEAMGENNKGVQIGAAMCLGKVVDCGSNESGFGKICVRVCKFLNSPNFFARSALLPVVGSLAQAGAITQQSVDTLLHSIHDCLASTDWATRKTAAEALIALALHSSELLKSEAGSTLTVLEACRFDKIKPVRDCVAEALQLWTKLSGKPENGALDGKASRQDAEEDMASDSSKTSVSDSVGKTKNGNFSDKAVGILKKKLPALTDKDLNPEFFQKLEKRGADELPVEVVVPRKCLNPSNSNVGEEESSTTETKDSTEKVSANTPFKNRDHEGYVRDRLVDDDLNGKDPQTRISGSEDKGSAFSKADGQSDGSLMNSKGNWLAIQRQLLQLERQQANLMNMLQEFMGGSHDSMVTLENRVRGLERVVEDMAHDLSISSNRRAGGFRSRNEGSSNRPSRYTGYFDYGGRLPYGDRFSNPEGESVSMRGRGSAWRSNLQEPMDFHSYGASKNGRPDVRRDVNHNGGDGRSPRSEHENDQVNSCRGWDKVAGNIRHGEGPSARSVWQASKDEATLAAIRVAGEDNGTARTARVAVRELDAELTGNDNNEPERDPIWTSWSNAMDAVHVGDMDTAYSEVLSTGDDSLLVKLMDRTGPVFDQLTDEIAVEALNAIMPFVVEQHLFDLCLSWVQQLLELVLENGSEVFGIPIEVKRDLLFNLHDATSAIEIPEDWEGATPDQLMIQLASAWNIDLQHSGR